MARGRFISRTISLSEQVDDLIDREGFEAGLVITWMIPQLDVEGRMKGNPKTVKAAVCPLRSDIDKHKIEAILAAADDLGLIKWYQVDDEWCIWFPKFTEHQQGLRKKREGASTVPEYSGSSPGVLPGKVSKGKVSQVKSSKDQGKASEVNSLSVSLRDPNRSDAIRSVFEYYRRAHPRSHKKPQSKSKEWKAIKERMDEGSTVEDLCHAIDGCHRTPHNVGQNDRNQTYLGLELIMRSSDQVTRFGENRDRFAPGSEASIKAGLAPKTRKTTEALQRFLSRDRKETPPNET